MGWWSNLFGKKETVTTTVTPPTTKGVVVTDYGSGESVTTKTSGGTISSQTYTPSPRTYSGGGGGSSDSTIYVTQEEVDKGYSTANLGEENAIALANRPGGTVEKSTLRPPTNAGTLKAQLDKVEQTGGNYQFEKKITGGTPINNGYALGTLVVSPKEASKLKGSGRAYWELSQTSNLQEGINEAQFAQNVPYISKPYKTTGLFQVNMANIYAGQEAYKQYKGISTDFQANPENYVKYSKEDVEVKRYTTGTTYELKPSFWEKNIDFSSIKTRSQEKASISFSKLPQQTQIKLQFQDFMVGGIMAGTAQVMTGTKEIGYKAVQNKFKVDAEGNFIRATPTKNRFETTYGNYPTAPKWIDPKGAGINTAIVGRGLVFLPPILEFGVSGVKNVRALGLAEGSAETLSYLSPFRIKSGFYAETLTAKTKFKVDSYKYTNPKGVTTEFYTGKSVGGETKVFGYSVGKGNIKTGYTATSTPGTNIRAGGSIIESGSRFSFSPYTSKPSGFGTGYLVKGNVAYLSQSFKGGTSKVVSSKGFTIYDTPTRTTYIGEFNKGYIYRSGAITDPAKNGVTRFVSGKASAQYKTTYGDTYINLKTGQFSKDFIKATTGKYTLSPQVAGRQYDLNKIFSLGKEEGFTSFRGGGGSSGKSALGYQTKVDTILNIPIAKTKPTSTFKLFTKVTPKETYGIVGLSGGSSIFTGLMKYERTEGGLFPKVKIRTKLDTPQLNILKTPSMLKPKINTKLGGVGATAIIVKQIIKPVTKQKTKQKTKQAQKIKLVQVQKVIFKTPTITTPLYSGFNFAPQFIPPTIIPHISLPLGMVGNLGFGDTRARKSKTSYAPSFSALFFKIRGKKGKPSKTGLDFRPITKKFSYQKKIKRLVKIRI